MQILGGDDERFENDWVASSFCESLTNYNVYPERLEDIPFEMGVQAICGIAKQGNCCCRDE